MFGLSLLRREDIEMLSRAYEALAPEPLLRHVMLLLLVLSMAMPTVFLLRLFALGAGIVAIVLALTVVDDPTGLFWSLLFVTVILVRLGFELYRGRGRPLTPEERLFHEKVVPSLSAHRAQKLIEAGQWRDVAAGTVLTREGELIGELCFVVRGLVDVTIDGEKLAECRAGSLIGEIGLSTGDAASTTVVCASPVRYLGFDAGRLYSLLDRHMDLQDAIELAIQRSLRDKIHSQNFAALHAAGGAAP
jgi:CRP-like cAMP-binding protein